MYLFVLLALGVHADAEGLDEGIVDVAGEEKQDREDDIRGDSARIRLMLGALHVVPGRERQDKVELECHAHGHSPIQAL